MGFCVAEPFEVSVGQRGLGITSAEHSVQLVDRSVEIFDETSVSWKGELSGWTWESAGRTGKISLEAPLQGRTEEKLFDQVTRHGTTKHAYYILRADMVAVQSEKLFLKPPRFLVDGTLIELPVITFSRTTEWHIGSLNC